MNVTETQQLTEVLERVQNWPAQMRILLARAILETIESCEFRAAAGSSPRRGKPVEELIGLGAGGSEPPSDRTVRQWLDEHRMGKFGR